MDTNITHHKALAVGTLLDSKYKILSILGSGSFGITYLALFTKLNSKVVIKEYFPSELAHRDSSSTVIPTSSNLQEYYHKGKEKFLFEAQTIAKFKHPYIVRVIDYFDENNTAYFVMDYEEGETLGEWITKQNSINEESVLPIIVPILEALSEIHAKHIYHRDIKPDNIYIRKGEVPMLIDFGAAKESYQEGSKASSFNPQTQGYAAPEQKSSIAKYIGAHTDIYAIGAVLHKVVTGHTPPTADDRSISRDNEGVDSYTPLATQNIQGYSTQFLSHIDWALSFLSRDRPQSAREFQKALMGTESETIIERPQLTNGDTVGLALPNKDEETQKRKKTKSKILPTIGAIMTIAIIIVGVANYDDIVKSFGDTKPTSPTVEVQDTVGLALPNKKAEEQIPTTPITVSKPIEITKEETLPPSKWLTPSKEICKANGGTIYEGVCQADWEDSKKICSATGGRLPTREELKAEIVKCGGEIKDDNSAERKRNRENTSYQSCYKENGFSDSNWYWTNEAYDSSSAWVVDFKGGNDGWSDKSSKGYALCVR